MNENPWKELSYSERMIHPWDEVAVEVHNGNAKPDYKFLLSMVPEPFVGNVKAPVLWLMANPGATKANAEGRFSEKNDEIISASIANLKQERNSFPLFHLDPDLAGTEGSDWYRKKLRWLLEESGEEEVANKLFTAELVPYHSVKWKEPKLEVPTQAYTRLLIEKAMERNAVILMARSYRLWIKQIPALEDYPRLFKARSPMNASISPNNYGNRNFDQIVEAINS